MEKLIRAVFNFAVGSADHVPPEPCPDAVVDSILLSGRFVPIFVARVVVDLSRDLALNVGGNRRILLIISRHGAKSRGQGHKPTSSNGGDSTRR